MKRFIANRIFDCWFICRHRIGIDYYPRTLWRWREQLLGIRDVR